MKPGYTVDAAIADLTSTRKAERTRASKALGTMGDPSAIGPLIRALSDPAIEVRRGAADSLGRLKAKEAIPGLVAAMADPDHSLRMLAAASLRKLGAAAYDPILAAYPGAGTPYRHAAIEVLWKFKKPAVTELLLAALEDPNTGIRFAAARFLGRRKDTKAVGPLVICLQDEDVVIVLEALSALASIGDPSAFEPVARVLDHPHGHVVHAALRTLRTIDNARAVDLIQGRLENMADAAFSQSVAGFDLMNAVSGLTQDVKAGRIDIGAMFLALQATSNGLAATLRGIREGTVESDADSASAIRNVEEAIRNIRRGQGG